MTFIQVDDPGSPDSEHILGKDDFGPESHIVRQDEELQAGGHPTPSSSIAPHSSLAEASSLPRRDIENEDLDLGVTRHRGFLSSGWNTPTNLTAGTPASVGFSMRLHERTQNNSEPKIISSHMLRHFKEGPGLW